MEELMGKLGDVWKSEGRREDTMHKQINQKMEGRKEGKKVQDTGRKLKKEKKILKKESEKRIDSFYIKLGK